MTDGEAALSGIPRNSWRGALRAIVIWLFGRLISQVPLQLRYRVTSVLSRRLLPLARFAPAHRELKAMHVERDADLALALALGVMDKIGVRYDPELRLEGETLLQQAAQGGNGTLVVGTHALLTQLIPRALTDRGYEPRVIANAARFRVTGTTNWLDSIQRSPYMLVQVRSALRRGDLVLALIDLQCAQANRSMTFHTKFGEIHLADALLRVAVACSAPTLFMMSETDGSGTVILTISSPVSGAHARADALLRDFADAVAGHVARL